MKTKTHLALVCFSLFTPPLFGQTNAPAASTNAAPAITNTISPFQQAVADCQQTWSFPNAEKVAKLTAGMDTLPPMPEEARKHFVMGETVFGAAKDTKDFMQAAMEFYQACTNAPWLAKVWNNMAVSCEKGGNYDYALNSLKVYQDFKLSDEEARAAQDMGYKIQAEKDLAAKHAADDWAIQQQAAAAEAAKAQAAAKAQTDAANAQAAAKVAADAAKEKAARSDFIRNIQGSWIDGSNFRFNIEQVADGTIKIQGAYPLNHSANVDISDIIITANILKFSAHSEGYDETDHFQLSLDSSGRLTGPEIASLVRGGGIVDFPGGNKTFSRQ